MQLINVDRQFKVLLANYICFTLSEFPPKKSQQVGNGNEWKNRSVRLGNSRAQKVILGYRVLRLQSTKGAYITKNGSYSNRTHMVQNT